MAESTAGPLWTPSAERIVGAVVSRFIARVNSRHKAGARSFPSLYARSIARPESSWDEVWGFTGIMRDKGSGRVLVVGRPMARPKITRVVDVHAVRDRVEAQFVAQAPEYTEKLGLAVITAVDVVGSVSGAFHFSGVDGRPTQIPFSRQLTTVRFLVTSQTGRYRRHSMGVTCPKNLVGDGSHEGRVGSSTKGRDNLTKVNHDRDELSQLDLQLFRKIQGFEVCHPSIVPCRGAQLLALRSLIHHLKQADSKNHE